jgi:hypothetical protein
MRVARETSMSDRNKEASPREKSRKPADPRPRADLIGALDDFEDLLDHLSKGVIVGDECSLLDTHPSTKHS